MIRTKHNTQAGSIYFSIIMPFFNRAEMLSRAIESCLNQTFKDFELIIINDASTDHSLAVASSYSDVRINIISNSENFGPCISRNEGIKNSTGKWVVMVDSDFALLPDALERLYVLTGNVSGAIGNFATSCRWDDGHVSPAIPSGQCELNFNQYLKWIEAGGITEKLECIRREVFFDILYPNSKAWEFEFHLKLASKWKVVLDPSICVNVYTDASNRITKSSGLRAAHKIIEEAPDKYASFRNIINDLGPRINDTAPKTYEYIVRLMVIQLFLCGYKLFPAKLIIRQYWLNPLRVSSLLIAVLGILLPKIWFARVLVLRRKFFAK
jgi:glycosyltransferase involved in cell wall biosynthesis